VTARTIIYWKPIGTSIRFIVYTVFFLLFPELRGLYNVTVINRVLRVDILNIFVYTIIPGYVWTHTHFIVHIDRYARLENNYSAIDNNLYIYRVSFYIYPERRFDSFYDYFFYQNRHLCNSVWIIFKWFFVCVVINSVSCCGKCLTVVIEITTVHCICNA
jgi:hypothetical protein